MILPAGFAMPDPALTPWPLHIVDKAGFAAWRDAQSPAVQAWLAAQRFDGSAGTAQSWADAHGAIGGAVIGIGDAPVHLYPADTSRPESEFLYAPQKGEGALKGVVIFAGDNFSGEPVYLVDPRDHPPLRIYAQTTSAMGRFSFEGLPPGPYQLIIGGSDPDKPFRWIEVPIEGNENKFLEISLDGPTLSGFISGPDNQPAGGAYAQIRLPEAKTQILRPYTILRPARSTRAGEFGQYQFSNLQEGTYELWASRYSIGVSPAQSADVKAGDVKDFNLRLQ